MSAIAPPFAARAKTARELESLIAAMLAIACGWFAPTTVWAAEATQPAPQKDGAAGPKTRAGQLLQDYRDDLVLIEGKSGKASGFIADIKGRKCLVSNAHVLAEIKTPRYKLLDNSLLRLGPAMVAIGHDIVMVNVLEGGKGIPTVPFGVAEARFGDEVVVPGNAGGESVVNPLRGEVVGIGADRIEISAPIEPGSSGSPIIHVRSGKAVGVASYLRIKPSLSRSGTNTLIEPKVRRFGYRLDTIQRWQVVDWNRFYAEADELRKIEHTSDELVTAFWDLGSASGANQDRHLYDSRAISSAIDQYFMAPKQGPGQASGAARDLLASLRAVSQSDVTSRRSFTYDCFQRRLEQETTLRKEIITTLDKALENL
jgi:hypothetical protein